MVAEGLRQVAQVAASEFWRRDRFAAGVDPVVTSDGRMLRFESFSLCGGVQARLDLTPEVLNGEVLDRGTTNIDINEPLRRLLTGVPADGLLHLSVGSDGLVATTADGAVIERRVSLSTRWLRGFAEAQQIASTFELRGELDGRHAATFLTSLPREGRGWVVPAGRGWRISSRAAPGSVHLAGSHRLASMLPLVRHARALRAYGPGVSLGAGPVASAWELALPGVNFVLMLSPDASRGFSGEGAALTALAAGGAVDDAEEIGRLLHHQPRLEPDLLAEQIGMTAGRVRSALACLAVAGRVGYDVTEASYFQRDLPYDAASVARLNPRLRQAEELVAAGAVTIVDDAVAEVVSSDRVHRTRVRADGTTACTCQWWITHRGSRGPCKHVVAAALARDQGPAA
ncbi:SWIM zinc finger family protein [Nocardioides lijunqiniae]|uniref:SWIM zinc finger family protein n=1 Tax=Nocardioides lijunqiniae TaxID=2760832 RepID=UPI0030B80FEC